MEVESRLSEELLSDDTIVLDTNVEDTSSLSENLFETKPKSPLVFKAHPEDTLLPDLHPGDTKVFSRGEAIALWVGVSGAGDSTVCLYWQNIDLLHIVNTCSGDSFRRPSLLCLLQTLQGHSPVSFD